MNSYFIITEKRCNLAKVSLLRYNIFIKIYYRHKVITGYTPAPLPLRGNLL